MTQYATAPDPIPSGAPYLTPGKRYAILDSKAGPASSLFSILDNDGDILICLLNGCHHLEGDWTIEDGEGTP